jgi:hypothetical protein
MATPSHTFAGWLDAHAAAPPTLSPAVPDATGPLAPLYRGMGGQLDGPPLLERYRILTPDDADAEKAAMDRLARDEAWDVDWWNPAWHPFATDDAGQLLVVDEPTGRVLEFLHDDHARPELAPDLDTLFTRIVSDLKAGTHVYDADFGIGTPEAHAHRRAERARFTPPPPRREGRPNAAMVLIGVPSLAFFAIGVTLQLGADVTAIGTVVVASTLTAVGWKLGWGVHDDPYARAADSVERSRRR